MVRYVTIVEGDSPETAVPILVTRDPRAVQAVLDALGRKLSEEPEPETASPKLELLPSRGAEVEP